MCYPQEEQAKRITIHGAVNTPLDISAHDLMAFSPFHINNVPILKERDREDQKEEIIGVLNFKGVWLRDLLERAGME